MNSNVINKQETHSPEKKDKVKKRKREENIVEQMDVDATESQTNAIDEYAEDTSDEEDLRNTVGNIPLHWYDDYDHIGYDLAGNKIIKPKKGDEIDQFLRRCEDPNYGRTVVDKLTGQEVILSDKDIELIQRYKKGMVPDSSVEWFPKFEDLTSHKKMVHPVQNIPPHKRSFVPSKSEKMKIARYVHAIKMGWMKPKEPSKDKEPDYSTYGNLWDDEVKDPNIINRLKRQIPVPKPPLPGHAESFRPPPEYLFTKEEEEKWESTEPDFRKLDFKPKSFPSLRLVPGYENFIYERYMRCLDLYLHPRQRRMKMNVDPESLIPKLPKPRDLMPFPNQLKKTYKGHTDMVRSLSIHATDTILASGSDDHTIRLWQIKTSRCCKVIPFEDKVTHVAWCPNPAQHLLAAIVDTKVYLLSPEVDDSSVVTAAQELIQKYHQQAEEVEEESAASSPVTWRLGSEEEREKGILAVVTHPQKVAGLAWHAKGDYFATIMKGSVIFHFLPKFASHMPKGQGHKREVQAIAFHPRKPFFFQATRRQVLIHNLATQERVKTLSPNCENLSTLAVHPLGDDVLVGSYSNKVVWFDLDLWTTPYKTMRYHSQAVRKVVYHPSLPLFASCSDDGKVVVTHGSVSQDLLQSALIAPVKVLRGHSAAHNLWVLDCIFHPHEPWLFSAGADGNIHLYTDA